jgi:hypothetical protein
VKIGTGHRSSSGMCPMASFYEHSEDSVGSIKVGTCNYHLFKADHGVPLNDIQ